MESPFLISIIIPTYNRAHLIGDTLDSILNQTYLKWECLIIDDGSSDKTDEVIRMYCKKDSRFKYYNRPDKHLPGGNGARNYGLQLAKGEYIIFFDSDDIMTENHVEVKINGILNFKVDYIITKTKFLNSTDDSLEKYYRFDQFDITAHNYIVQNINWLTYDTLIKTKLAKKIEFNELLKSGQEYNFFSKLVIHSTKCKFIDEYLTLRRKHEESKRAELRKNTIKQQQSYLLASWLTYIDIKDGLSKKTTKSLLFRIVKICFALKSFPIPQKKMFFSELSSNFKYGKLYFVLMLIFEINFNRGYFFRNKLKKQL